MSGTSSVPEFEVAVIGAGIVGLSVAAALARRGRSVLVLERREAIARETTSRNSEVVHAGIYYPAGSWKAVLCVEGREALYARCERLGLPHRRIGKLIVATSADEIPVLERLQRAGLENGAPGLELVDGRAVAALEPAVRAVAGLRSPATGIVDAHALATSYAAEAEAGGAVIALHTEVVGAERAAPGYRLAVADSDGGRTTLSCVAVVNAAGLGADRVAALPGIDVDARGYRLHYCKGDYFSVAPGAALRLERLVYPVPAGPGLGVHATLDLAGRMRFGPDAEFVPEPAYGVDPAKAEAFAEAARRYLPTLEAEWLSPDYAGVRPRLAGPGEGFRDFVIAEESDAGLPGWVNLIGIESPGLTAAHAIAERVATLLSAL
jgi:L-2-hydroxyglutarate oxidase LhgO